MSGDGGAGGREGAARPLRSSDFAGLEAFVRTPDEDVGGEDDGVDRVIFGLGDHEPDWQLAALEDGFDDPEPDPGSPAGGKLPFQFLDAAAPAQPPADLELAPLPPVDLEAAAAAAGGGGGEVDGGGGEAEGDGGVQAYFAGLAGGPAAATELPSAAALHEQQQQQQRLYVLQQQQQLQQHELHEQQRRALQTQRALHHHQLQLAQLDAASRLAAAGAGAGQSPVCQVCGRAFPPEDTTDALRRHEQTCRRGRRPPTHCTSPSAGAEAARANPPPSPAASAPPGGGGGAEKGGGSGSGSGSGSAAAAAAAGAAAAMAAVGNRAGGGGSAGGVGGGGGSGGGDAVMSSPMLAASPALPPRGGRNGSDGGCMSAGGFATDGSRKAMPPTARNGGPGGAPAQPPTRRDADLVEVVRRLERTISTLDVSARLCLRDALISLSNKASNPNLQPTPEQEAMNRAAEYLVLRMLFLSGHQVPHTAPGTAPMPAPAGVPGGALPAGFPAAPPTGMPGGGAMPASFAQQQQQQQLGADRAKLEPRTADAGARRASSPSDVKTEPSEATSPSSIDATPRAPSGLSPGGGTQRAARAAPAAPPSLGLDRSKNKSNPT